HMGHPLFNIIMFTALFSSLVSIMIAFRWKGTWVRIAATLLSFLISLLPALWHPGLLPIPLIFPLLVYRGIGLAYEGNRGKGLLYCGPYIVFSVLLIFFTYIFVPILDPKTTLPPGGNLQIRPL
ncbi:MAG: hypothetical protein V4628_17240, partial [Pseudomonadota bacterium]